MPVTPTTAALAAAVLVITPLLIGKLVGVKTVWVDNWHANASNTALKITMRKGHADPRPIWAQEYFEATRKHNIFWLLRITLPFLREEGQRQLEYRGHAVEVETEAQLGGDEREARLREAKAMKAGYNSLFAHMTTLEIVLEMSRHAPMAKSWVRKNWDKINAEGVEP